MAEIENIFSTLFFLIIGIIIIFISFIGFTNYQQIDYTLDLNKYNYQKNYNKFETFMLITDSYSKKSLIDTYVLSLPNNLTYSTIYGNISINESLKMTLDYLFGEENYYLKLTPKIFSIKINMFYDEGELLSEINKKENFSQLIVDLINSSREIGLKLEFELFIISDNVSSLECNKYLNLDIPCNKINLGDLYEPLSSIHTERYGNKNLLEDPVKTFYSISENSSIPFQVTHYSIKDWGTILSKVSVISYRLDEKEKISNADLILFFSNALNLGGQNDSFFTTPYDKFIDDSCDVVMDFSLEKCSSKCEGIYWPNQKEKYNSCVGYVDSNFLENSLDCPHCEPVGTSCYGVSIIDYLKCIEPQNEASWGYWHYQNICIENSNFTISNYSVVRSIDILKMNRHIVFPILIYENNFSETNKQNYYMKQFDKPEYVRKVDGVNLGFTKSPELNGGNYETICGKSSCSACYENSSAGINHYKTREAHLSQLNYVASQTTGKVLIYEETNLLESLELLIQEMLTRNILDIGIIKNDTNKQIFSKKILSQANGNSMLIEIYFEVYPDLNYNFEDEMLFKPIINNFELSVNDLIIYVSHNAEISSISLNSNLGKIVLENSIENLVYRYKITFENVSNYSEEIFIFNYKDSLEIKNSFNMKNPFLI